MEEKKESKFVEFMFKPYVMGLTAMACSSILVFSIIYLDRIDRSSSWNWNEQTTILKRQTKERNEREARFSYLYPLFLHYLDEDSNEIISLEEQGKGWKKLGYHGPFFESNNNKKYFTYSDGYGQIHYQFPTITIKDLDSLEKAVKSYENE